jgi:hypothetical protein
LPTATVVLAVDRSAFPQEPTLRYVLGPADMTGVDVAHAVAEKDPTKGEYAVELTLTATGASQFDLIGRARYACYEQDTSNPPSCSMEAFEIKAEALANELNEDR